jgi:hypothetical protein
MCHLFATLQQRYEGFASEILILSFCVYVSTLHVFLLCLFSYSGLILVLTSFLLYPYLSTAIRAAGGFQATACQVHIPYFYFSITGYFYFRRVVRNDSLVRRLRRQRSRPCAVGRLGTIERRRRVTVLVNP